MGKGCGGQCGMQDAGGGHDVIWPLLLIKLPPPLPPSPSCRTAWCPWSCPQCMKVSLTLRWPFCWWQKSDLQAMIACTPWSHYRQALVSLHACHGLTAGKPWSHCR